MEAICSSETSAFTTFTLCHIAENWFLHSHRRENLKSYFAFHPEDGGENHDPTKSEIAEYTEWLGGKLPDDRDLMWIVCDALKAPMPPNWKVYQRNDGSNESFYFNPRTGKSQWERPLDQHFKDLFWTEKDKKIESDGSSPTPNDWINDETYF